MAKPKTKSETTTTAEPEIISYKGFDLNLACRGYQYEVGKTYEHTGDVAACESGFHACEHPLNVFDYYPPATSRYAVVRQGGKIARHKDDAKIASARITIEAELALPELIQRAVKWVFDRANWKDGPIATGENEGVSVNGDQGAATASGDQGAATASGDQGAVRADKDGCALFLVYRDEYSGEIKHAWAGISGRNGIKSGVWYRLNAEGEPTEITR